MSSPIEAATWCHALTLAERVAPLRQASDRSPLDPAAQERSARRAARWRDELGADRLTDRLALEDQTEDEWRHVLGEPIEDLKARVPEPPAWLRELVAAYEAAPVDVAVPPAASGVLVAVAPPLHRARERLRAGLEDLRRAHPDAPFEADTLVRMLAPAVEHTLSYMADRTLVLELHAARHRGELDGETAEARFASFVERLRRPEVALAILEEYPVLARQIVRLLDQWVASGLELAARLCADWSDLRATFAGGADPGELVALELTGSDRHRGGRTVVIVGFADGLRVVYKPKPLGVDVHFQELLSWLDDRGADPPLRTLTVLDRGSYGWLEFVPAAGCASEEEVRRFYRRQGSLTMLLYALAATDFHFENLIAAGEHPVLIDLETLLHPLIGPEDPVGAQESAEQLLSRSVLRSGMVPEWMWGDGASRGIEISGLGAHKGQQTPFGSPTWEAAGTDDMHLVRKPSVVPAGRNRPTLNGDDVDLLRYTGEIVRGFTATYRLLMAHREALLAPDGPIQRFADDEVRVILRPSQRYGVMLYGGYHPNLLRSGLDRDRHFDRLWVGIDQHPLLRAVLPAERADLYDGDFPIFVTRPGARDLWSSRGVRYPDAYPRSGLELVRQIVRGLDDGDLERQLGLVRNALATLVSSPEGRAARSAAVAIVPAAEEADRDRLLAVARAVGDRLETLAVQAAGEATWVGLMSQGQALASRPVDVGLYGGRSGIALFLGHLGAVTGDDRYTGLARAALRSALREVDARPASVSTIGAHDGWGALIYTLAHLGALWDDRELRARAEQAVEQVSTRIDADDRLDVVGGAAGCIGSLLALHALAPSPRTLAVAAACGERLLATAVPQARGRAWPAPVEVQAPLTGFSHGASGMAWALARLATATGDDRFRDLAAAALAYERTAFVPEVGNWPDWRKDDAHPEGGEAVFVCGWCHGAPGIGLSRLGLLGHLDDPEIHAEIDVALRTTRAEGFGDTHSLCHGDLGNLELLLVGADVLGRPELREEARRLAASVLADVERRGWLCGTPLRVEAPGLMVGLAGMGYGLLRLAEPERVPSVLLLAPPAAR